FQEKLCEPGYAEGQNLVIEFRYAEGRTERLPGLAAELILLNVDVVVVASDPGRSLSGGRYSSLSDYVTWIGAEDGPGLLSPEWLFNTLRRYQVRSQLTSCRRTRRPQLQFASAHRIRLCRLSFRYRSNPRTEIRRACHRLE